MCGLEIVVFIVQVVFVFVFRIVHRSPAFVFIALEHTEAPSVPFARISMRALVGPKIALDITHRTRHARKRRQHVVVGVLPTVSAALMNGIDFITAIGHEYPSLKEPPF